MTILSRRGFLSVGAVAATTQFLPPPATIAAEPKPKVPARPLFYTGGGLARGSPNPHTFKGEELVKARLTPKDWRLEIVGHGGAKVEKPRKFSDSTAIDLPTLLELGKKHGVKFIKAMQCRSSNWPQDQAIWEGVPLREVLKLAGKLSRVMRVYANGFHNDDPKQLFQSSASYTQVFESAPGELPVIVAYRHNGAPIPVTRGGPVRLIMPWAYGFKNIKWLQRLRLTDDTKPIDTYGGEPEAYLKTHVPRIDGAAKFKAGAPVAYYGRAVVGVPGLKRVEYWLRPDTGKDGKLADDDPAWNRAAWQPCVIEPPPADWSAHLPKGMSAKELWGFDPNTGKPKEWPMRYTVVNWAVTVKGLKPGAYELRVRTVDLNGFAQPQPRPHEGTGRNQVPCKIIKVTA
jgi:DMSO/TMAO reductase YedYZ molybdopterin-dependent catalytic subunit